MGAAEREQCYKPILDEMEERFSLDEYSDRTLVRILVPGAGLGRLAWEVAARGYTCQGNEFSLFMLFASNFILNRCTEINKYTVHPWVHQYVNNITCEHQLISAKFPDVCPSGNRPNHNFSMTAGDFLKAFLLALSKYTKKDNERKILEYLCSKEGSAAYSTYILDKNLSILDIFTIFKSCKPPIEVLLANLPRLFPRPYSIVNSGIKDDGYIKICFSVIMTNNNRKGLTTGWLEDLILNEDLSFVNGIKSLCISRSNYLSKERVPIYLRKNLTMFCLPRSLETPLILIGPGTGVSPFIGFLEEREILKKSNPDVKLGDVWLFFGCRNPELDFLYEEELNAFLSRGTLNKLFTAFSRVDDYETKYIQDALTQNGKQVTQLIEDGASVFVCGDLNTMDAEIKEVLIQCFVDHYNMTVQEAQSKISKMQKDKRYVVSMWS